jgi:predicted aspartyl protease
MIEGRFGEKGELFFELELVVADGNLLVEALLDTGFTEFLALNKQDVENLNWLYFDQEELLTAKGLFVFDIYIGKIILKIKMLMAWVKRTEKNPCFYKTGNKYSRLLPKLAPNYCSIPTSPNPYTA